MQRLLEEVRLACELKLYYLAIMLCLALPDICAALESPKGRSSEKQYEAWFDKWLAPYYGEYMTGQDMYRLRSSVGQQGKMGHPALRYKRVVFALSPLLHKHLWPYRAKPEILNLSISMFCQDIVISVQAWEIAHKHDPVVQSNLSRLIQYHPSGLLPYLEGLPCIMSTR